MNAQAAGRGAAAAAPRLAAMLAALTAATFLVTTSGIALAPFFITLAADLNAGLVAVTNLVTVMASAWGLSALIAGRLSDHVGRRPILVTAVLLMGCAQLVFSRATGYPLALVCQVLAGLAGGAYMGVVFAAVSDHVAPARRGRALGWLVTGQSLSLVLGVPLITLLAAAGGWRQALLSYGAAVVVMAIAVAWLTPATRRRDTATGDASPVALAELLRPQVLLLLLAGIAERVCFAVVAVYMAIYLQRSYGVSLAELSAGLALVAAGNVAGNILGGQIADRIAARTLFYALSALTTALVALPLMLIQPGLELSLALGFVYSFANAAGRPALMAALSEVPADVRGAVFGVNITTSSLGWITAAAFGGWLMTRHGFAALGVLCAAAALCGAGFGLWHWWRQPRVR